MRIDKVKIIGFFLLAVTSNYSIAQDDGQTVAQGRDFAGINFGIGISLTLDTGSNDRVESAELDEAGIVRISQDQNNVARIMLESHYFFLPKGEFLGVVKEGRWGHGPFIACLLYTSPSPRDS